jgi:hypothetical protein
LEEELEEALSLGRVKSVKCRLKGPFSIYEKQETKPAVQHDLIGVEIVVSDLQAVWRTVRLLKKAKGLSRPTQENLRSFPYVHIGIEKGLVQVEKDDISRPRERGFSAYTLLLVYDNEFPVEFQVTTPVRAEQNRKGEAAHWKYKTERSLELLEVEHGQDFSAEEAKEGERLVLLSEKAPSFPDHLPDPFEMRAYPKRKVDILTGSTITRVPGSLRSLGDLEGYFGAKAKLYEIQFDRQYAQPEIVSRKSRSNMLLKDGMIIALER